jgi:hypothetical protein
MRQDLARNPDWGWPGVECRHHRGGILKPVLGIGGAVVCAFGWIYQDGYEHAHRAPKPRVEVITRTVTRTVAGHPVLTGWQWVLALLVLAAAAVGCLWVYGRWIR